MTQFTKTEKNRIKRLPKRGNYDRETIYRILDEALICHVGFAEKGQPCVIPINFARVDDSIVLHGAKASRLLKHIETGTRFVLKQPSWMDWYWHDLYSIIP